MADSALALASHPSDIKIYLGVDRDDPSINEYQGLPLLGIILLVSEKKRSAPALMQWLCDKADGELIFAVADDLIFRTQGWDDMICEAFALYPDNMLVANTNDMNGSSKVTHFVVTREWINVVGKYVPSEFEHFSADEYVERIAKGAGRLLFLNDVHVEHLHAKYKKGVNDETYRAKRMKSADGTNMSQRDNARMQKMMPEIDAAIKRVRKAMSA